MTVLSSHLPAPDVTLRLSVADGADGESICRLASLANSSPPDGPVVLAEVDGEPVAALGIADGSVVADPLRTSEAVVFNMRLRRWEARLIGSIWGF